MSGTPFTNILAVRLPDKIDTLTFTSNSCDIPCAQAGGSGSVAEEIVSAPTEAVETLGAVVKSQEYILGTLGLPCAWRAWEGKVQLSVYVLGEGGKKDKKAKALHQKVEDSLPKDAGTWSTTSVSVSNLQSDAAALQFFFSALGCHLQWKLHGSGCFVRLGDGFVVVPSHHGTEDGHTASKRGCLAVRFISSIHGQTLCIQVDVTRRMLRPLLRGDLSSAAKIIPCGPLELDVKLRDSVHRVLSNPASGSILHATDSAALWKSVWNVDMARRTTSVGRIQERVTCVVGGRQLLEYPMSCLFVPMWTRRSVGVVLRPPATGLHLPSQQHLTPNISVMPNLAETPASAEVANQRTPAPNNPPSPGVTIVDVKPASNAGAPSPRPVAQAAATATTTSKASAIKKSPVAPQKDPESKLSLGDILGPRSTLDHISVNSRKRALTDRKAAGNSAGENKNKPGSDSRNPAEKSRIANVESDKLPKEKVEVKSSTAAAEEQEDQKAAQSLLTRSDSDEDDDVPLSRINPVMNQANPVMGNVGNAQMMGDPDLEAEMMRLLGPDLLGDLVEPVPSAPAEEKSTKSGKKKKSKKAGAGQNLRSASASPTPPLDEVVLMEVEFSDSEEVSVNAAAEQKGPTLDLEMMKAPELPAPKPRVLPRRLPLPCYFNDTAYIISKDAAASVSSQAAMPLLSGRKRPRRRVNFPTLHYTPDLNHKMEALQAEARRAARRKLRRKKPKIKRSRGSAGSGAGGVEGKAGSQPSEGDAVVIKEEEVEDIAMDKVVEMSSDSSSSDSSSSDESLPPSASRALMETGSPGAALGGAEAVAQQSPMQRLVCDILDVYGVRSAAVANALVTGFVRGNIPDASVSQDGQYGGYMGQWIAEQNGVIYLVDSFDQAELVKHLYPNMPLDSSSGLNPRSTTITKGRLGALGRASAATPRTPYMVSTAGTVHMTSVVRDPASSEAEEDSTVPSVPSINVSPVAVCAMVESITPAFASMFGEKNISAKLPLDEFISLSGSLLAKKSGENVVGIDAPQMIGGYDGQWLQMPASALPHWEKALLEPYTEKKNIEYYVMCPDNKALVDTVDAFMSELSCVYESCGLGAAGPGDSVRDLSFSSNGIIRVPVYQTQEGDYQLNYKLCCDNLLSHFATRPNVQYSVHGDRCTVVLAINPHDSYGPTDLSSTLGSFYVSASVQQKHKEAAKLNLSAFMLPLEVLFAQANLMSIMKDISFRIFSTCRRQKVFRETPDVNARTRTLSKIYEPAVIAHRSDSGKVMDCTVHCCYYPIPGSDSTAYTWTDDRGELLECLVHTGEQPGYLEILCEGMRWVNQRADDGFDAVLCISKIGKMTTEEVAAWQEASGDETAFGVPFRYEPGVEYNGVTPKDTPSKTVVLASADIVDTMQLIAAEGLKSERPSTIAHVFSMGAGSATSLCGASTLASAAVLPARPKDGGTAGIEGLPCPTIMQIAVHKLLRQAPTSSSNLPGGHDAEAMARGMAVVYHRLSWLEAPWSPQDSTIPTLLPFHFAATARMVNALQTTSADGRLRPTDAVRIDGGAPT